jgi:hypothetical protein
MKKNLIIGMIFILGIFIGPVTATPVYYSHHGLPDSQPEPSNFQEAINHDMIDHVTDSGLPTYKGSILLDQPTGFGSWST